MEFNDGITFDTSGPLRIERRRDGLYLVGENMLEAIATRKEGDDLIRAMKERRCRPKNQSRV